MKEYKYRINGNNYTVAVGDIDDNFAQIEVNGVPYKVELEQTKAKSVTVSTPKASPAPRKASGEKVIASKPAAGGKGSVVAPLPGGVISIAVKVGDTVSAGDTVVMLEAMKMENSIRAGRDGRVASVNVNPGDSVLEGATLITIE